MPLDPITQAAGGQILGMALGAYNDRRQIKQQEKLQDIQIRGQKAMAMFNYDQQMKMWEATGYGAQKDQMKRAGLNPALLYGMGGGGGQSTSAQSGSTTGATAQQGGGGELGMALQGAMQLQLLKAQKENIEADTANKRQGTAKSAMETEQGYLNLDKSSETYWADVTRIKHEAQSAVEKYQSDYAKGVIDVQTMNKRIEEVEVDVANKVLQGAVMESNIKMNEQEMRESAQRIVTQITQLEQRGRELNQRDKEILIKEETNRLIEKGIEWGAAAQVIGKVVDVVSRGMTKAPEYNTFQNYDQRSFHNTFKGGKK